MRRMEFDSGISIHGQDYADRLREAMAERAAAQSDPLHRSMLIRHGEVVIVLLDTWRDLKSVSPDPVHRLRQIASMFAGAMGTVAGAEFPDPGLVVAMESVGIFAKSACDAVAKEVRDHLREQGLPAPPRFEMPT